VESSPTIQLLAVNLLTQTRQPGVKTLPRMAIQESRYAQTSDFRWGSLSTPQVGLATHADKENGYQQIGKWE